MVSFDPIYFIPRQRRPQILASPVRRIIAAPHATEGGTNHWCFYLITSPETSVSFDCQPSHTVPSTVISGGSKAYLIISELSCVVSCDVQGEFDLDVGPGLKVEHFYDTFVENGRHKYEFDPQGVGCRYWTCDQIDLLRQLSLITDDAQISTAKNAILKLWPDQIPLPLDKGAYYQ